MRGANESLLRQSQPHLGHRRHAPRPLPPSRVPQSHAPHDRPPPPRLRPRPHQTQVLATQKQWSNKAADALLRKAACQTFYNTSKLDFANPNLQQAGAANTRDHFAYALYQHLEELAVNRMDRNGGHAGMFFANPEVRTVIQNWMLDQVYDRLRAKP